MSNSSKGNHNSAMQNKSLMTRRRSLQIIGTAILAPSAFYSSASVANEFPIKSQLKQISWKGIVLGANASIVLSTTDEAHAKSTISKMLTEVKRLESYFSLYQKNSSINQLNENGVLNSPPKEFKTLISEAIHYSNLTDGAFDPTIQPLFMAYKNMDHSDKTADIANHPSIQKAVHLINWKNIDISKSDISFKVPQMAITLNGIAQGYITDKAVEILKTNGFENTLVNFGEYHGIGSKLPEQNKENGWNIQLGKTNTADKHAEIWNLKNNALAASSHNGYHFKGLNGLHHMLDPRTGKNQPTWREIYVLAKTATKADAASTALFASAPDKIEKLTKKLNLQKTLFIKDNGAKLIL